MVLGIDLGLMRQQLVDKRWAGFPVLGELARREENARGAISQHIVIVDLHTTQFRHRHWIHLGRRSLAISQQLPGIGAFRIGAAEVLPEAPAFELHVRAAFIAFD